MKSNKDGGGRDQTQKCRLIDCTYTLTKLVFRLHVDVPQHYTAIGGSRG